MPSWYLTFHGGEGRNAWNNIHAFDLDGRHLGKRLSRRGLPRDVHLRELRGFAFGPDGDLYVANAYRKASQVLRFGGGVDARGRHRFKGVFSALRESNPGLDHPFQVMFGPQADLFVPCQDTNVVGRYFGPTSSAGEAGTPMPYPECLVNHTAELDTTPPPGTFVPSHHHASEGLAAVRGICFGSDDRLYVADRDNDCIRSYDGTSGAWQRDYRHAHLSKPVHLQGAGPGRLLVGSRNDNAIFELDTASGQFRTLIPAGAGGLSGPAGMAIGPDGKLYVCSRKSKQVLRYELDSGRPDPKPFLDKLPDRPEFIGLVHDPVQ